MMLKTGQYQTKEYQNKEDWWLFAYLKEKYILQGLSTYEYIPLIKEKWKQIFQTRFTNLDVSSEFTSDSLIINSHFHNVQQNGNGINLNPSYKRITIYQSELDYINSIPAPKWFREFLFLFLAHCKTIGRNKFEYAPIRDYMKYLSLKTKNRDLITDTIYKKLRELNLWHPVKVKRTIKDDGNIEEYSDIWFKFVLPVKSSGKKTIENCSIMEIIKNLDLVTDQYRCDICGEEFTFGSRTQRTICDKCYKKQRRQHKTLTMRKLRQG